MLSGQNRSTLGRSAHILRVPSAKLEGKKRSAHILRNIFLLMFFIDLNQLYTFCSCRKATGSGQKNYTLFAGHVFPQISTVFRVKSASSSTIHSALWENAHPSLAAVGVFLATAGPPSACACPGMGIMSINTCRRACSETRGSSRTSLPSRGTVCRSEHPFSAACNKALQGALAMIRVGSLFTRLFQRFNFLRDRRST